MDEIVTNIIFFEKFIKYHAPSIEEERRYLIRLDEVVSLEIYGELARAW